MYSVFSSSRTRPLDADNKLKTPKEADFLRLGQGLPPVYGRYLGHDRVQFSGRVEELRKKQLQTVQVDMVMNRFIVGQINAQFSEGEYEGEAPDLAQLEKNVLTTLQKSKQYPINRVKQDTLETGQKVTWPLLHEAIFYSLPTVVDYILTQNPDLSQKNSLGENALETAESGVEVNPDDATAIHILDQVQKAYNQRKPSAACDARKDTNQDDVARQIALGKNPEELAREIMGDNSVREKTEQSPESGALSKSAKQRKKAQQKAREKEAKAKALQQQALEAKRSELNTRFTRLSLAPPDWSQDASMDEGKWEVVASAKEQTKPKAAYPPQKGDRRADKKSSAKASKSNIPSDSGNAATGSTGERSQTKPDQSMLKPAKVPTINPWKTVGMSTDNTESRSVIEPDQQEGQKQPDNQTLGLEKNIADLRERHDRLQQSLEISTHISDRQANEIKSSQLERKKLLAQAQESQVNLSRAQVQLRAKTRELSNWRVAFETQRQELLALQQTHLKQEALGKLTAEQQSHNFQQEERALRQLESGQEQIQKLQTEQDPARVEEIMEEGNKLPKVKLSSNPDDYIPCTDQPGYKVREGIIYAGLWVPGIPVKKR